MKKSILVVSVIFIASITSAFANLDGSFTLPVSQENDYVKVNVQEQNKQQALSKTLKDVYTCPMHPKVTSEKPGKCPECKMNLVKKDASKVTYSCPMHPEVTGDKPGKCPKCKMKLVEKKANTPAK